MTEPPRSLARCSAGSEHKGSGTRFSVSRKVEQGSCYARSEAARAWRKFYSTPAWRAARTAQLRKQPLCERCSTNERPVVAGVVNHRTPHKGDWDLFIDPANHESVCKPCHDGEIQSEERRGHSTRVGVDGWPIDERHPAYQRP